MKKAASAAFFIQESLALSLLFLLLSRRHGGFDFFIGYARDLLDGLTHVRWQDQACTLGNIDQAVIKRP